MYGRSTKSIAEQLNISVKKAQDITDKFFTSFPKIKDFMNNTQQQAREYGFVETAWGRKRRLPNMMLDEYELTLTSSSSFDPLDFEGDADTSVPDELYWYFITKLKKAFYFKDKQSIKEEAKQRGILIKDNTNIISEATRQCVNSVIQGTSADITKKAMINVGTDSQMMEWGVKIVLQIHDELIVECPIKYARECAKRLSELMLEAPKEKIKVPMKCDTEITKCWYGEVIELD